MATAGETFRLARVLRELALAVTADDADAPPLSLVLVTDDIAHHDGTTVSEVVARTGFAQSLVSRVVGQLREAGIVDVAPDPADGRRSLITVTRVARTTTFAERGGRGIRDALRERYPDRSGSQLAAVERLLERLAALIAE